MTTKEKMELEYSHDDGHKKKCIMKRLIAFYFTARLITRCIQLRILK